MSIEKFEPSYDIHTDRFEKLKAIVPEAFTDGKINWDKLKECLGSFVEEEGSEVEHYAFTWPGKREARRLASKPPQGTLVPALGEGVDEDKTDNIFIEGDNLEVLKLLQKSYADKIKMIYIDPPYNTGNDFIYNDNFTEPLEEYLRLTRQIDSEGSSLVSNKKASGRFHSKWMNMMSPRLLLARNLLKDDGLIFISIDDNEVSNLRKLCDDVFGEENFLGCAARVSKKANNQGEYWSPNFDYLLTYSKNRNECLPFFGGVNYEAYDQIEEDGPRKGEKYQLVRLYMTSLDPMRGCTNQRYYIEAPDGTLLIPPGSIFPEIGKDGELIPPQSENDKIWRWTRNKYLEQKDRIVIKRVRSSNLVDKNGNEVKWNVFTKTYLNDVIKNTSAKPNSLIEEHINQISSHELNDLKIIFDFAKPSTLVKYLCEISMVDSTAIILDFFSGSATTAHAVLDLNKQDGGNRKFICVQLPEVCTEDSEAFKNGYKTIAEIGKERIRRVIKKIREESKPEEIVNQDLGFKAFKLRSSHFKEWKDYAGRDVKELMELFTKQEDALVDGWKPADLLIEVMLQEGFPLNSKISLIKEIDKNKVYKVTSDFCEHPLFICFDGLVEQNTIKALPLSDKDIFICLDSALTDEQKVVLADKGVIKTI